MKRLICVIFLLLGACVQTTYRGYDGDDQQTPALSRDVRYEISDVFYRDPPDCVTVLPIAQNLPKDVAVAIEREAARQLFAKVDRVIGPHERNRQARRIAVDLASVGDRRVFAASQRCHWALEVTVSSFSEGYAVIWAGKEVGLDLALMRMEDGKTLWRASHTARRGDGDVPLSPIGLGGAAFRAGRAHTDPELLPSLVADACRVMFRSLPDVRS